MQDLSSSRTAVGGRRNRGSCMAMAVGLSAIWKKKTNEVLKGSKRWDTTKEEEE